MKLKSFRKTSDKRGRFGFTLIELLIVVAIIAILAAIAMPNFMEAQVRSKVSRVRSDMRSVSVALESYAVDNNIYPPARPLEQYGVNHYRSYCYFLTQRSVNSGNVNGSPYLTTPIAYITSIPFDPFIGKAKISQPGMIEIAQASFLYVNVQGGYRASVRPGWNGGTLLQ